MKLNNFQKAICRTHGGGDYAFIVDLPEGEVEAAYKNAGDTLFTFMMIELADEGVELMTRETAVQRLETAAREIKAALWHVDSAATERG